MKIALTTTGSTLDAPLNSAFGRAPKFLIYDTESDQFEIKDNLQNLNASQGAGVQSAQAIVKSGAHCLISGHCGPKAFRVLKASNVQVYYSNAATVSEALALFRAGRLHAAAEADVDGH